MNLLKKAAVAFFSLGALVLAGCGTGPEMGNAQEQAAASSGLTGYRLGSGDEVKITIFGEKDLSGSFVVDGQGAVAMSLVGAVTVANLTLDDTGRLIESKYRDGWLRDPRVTVELVKGRPYYILGEVNRPGEYPFSSGLTVMNAIASAGDFTYRADRNKILIKSSDSPNEREVELTPTTAVRPGDTIRIKERFF